MTAVMEKDVMKRIIKFGELWVVDFEDDGQNGCPKHDLCGFSKLIMDPMSHGQVKNLNYKSVQLCFGQSDACSGVWINVRQA